MKKYYRDFVIRNWQPDDRQIVANIISSVLAEYGLNWEPKDADRDVLQVEKFYQNVGGEFWVIEKQEKILGTAAYYTISRGNKAAEIRKMYLLPEVRNQGLGKFLLKELENKIIECKFQEIWIETATVLQEAVKLYESSGYHLTTGVETKRCDRIYQKILDTK
ncbi:MULTISPECIES: GNAT family N-acetyltransferase [Okeania]|uniref:GNAT family N-acetyltransferase n=1 Tax=Okeania hirsuta TaxID=1458930 RepID=A0A3N6PW66_9CYAN|nr:MULTISPECIES: GNAT family N-acetyltransferase [Okeania]NES92019.1 GNAT family N-acetyltransferase [Okeania sp. SIO2B9]NET75413.1 GNAT family N-acetyltransferase [Okeania sp. SIO1F9]RQH44649.1 GNAT family N-acetyltransferase [Okeania hirsuta]